MDENEGIAAIIDLQGLLGIVETSAEARAHWARMSPRQRRQTLELREAMALLAPDRQQRVGRIGRVLLDAVRQAAAPLRGVTDPEEPAS
jgi:hypothetical protein